MTMQGHYLGAYGHNQHQQQAANQDFQEDMHGKLNYSPKLSPDL
jgi:hypothetical protein